MAIKIERDERYDGTSIDEDQEKVLGYRVSFGKGKDSIGAIAGVPAGASIRETYMLVIRALLQAGRDYGKSKSTG